MRRGMTQSSAKAKSTPMMSIKIFSETLGVQNITKQSWRVGQDNIEQGCEEKAYTSEMKRSGLTRSLSVLEDGEHAHWASSWYSRLAATHSCLALTCQWGAPVHLLHVPHEDSQCGTSTVGDICMDNWARKGDHFAFTEA